MTKAEEYEKLAKELLEHAEAYPSAIERDGHSQLDLRDWMDRLKELVERPKIRRKLNQVEMDILRGLAAQPDTVLGLRQRTGYTSIGWSTQFPAKVKTLQRQGLVEKGERLWDITRMGRSYLQDPEAVIACSRGPKSPLQS